MGTANFSKVNSSAAVGDVEEVAGAGAAASGRTNAAVETDRVFGDLTMAEM